MFKDAQLKSLGSQSLLCLTFMAMKLESLLFLIVSQPLTSTVFAATLVIILVVSHQANLLGIQMCALTESNLRSSYKKVSCDLFCLNEENAKC